MASSLLDDILRRAVTQSAPKSGLTTSVLGGAARRAGVSGALQFGDSSGVPNDFWGSAPSGGESYADPNRMLPWWKRTAASAVTSPVGKGLFAAAGALALPQRAALSAVQSLSELPSDHIASRISGAVARSVPGAQGTVGLIEGLRKSRELYSDSDWTPEGRESTIGRSWWDRTKDVSYGFGDVYADVSGGGFAGRAGVEDGFWTSGRRWADRAIGLSGDLATDPLVAISVGSKTLGAGPRMALAVKAEAAGLPVDRVAKIARLGEAVLTDSERAALGARSGAMRFAGVDIVGTKRVGRGVGVGLARTRDVVTSSRPWQRISRAAPEGQELAYRVLRTGKAEDGFGVLDAVGSIRYQQNFRAGQQRFKALFGQEPAKILGKRDSAQRVGLTHIYESQALNGAIPSKATRNTSLATGGTEEFFAIADFFEAAFEEFKKQGGNPGYISGYLPHMMSKEFWDYLNSGTSEAADAAKAIGIDLTAEPGIFKTRTLKKGTTVTVNGKTITLVEGTIKEINDKIGRELGVKVMEDDLAVLMTAYVEDAAQGLGLLQAVNSLSSDLTRVGRTLDSLSTQEIDDFAMASGNKAAVQAARDVVAQRVAERKAAEETARRVGAEIVDEMVLSYTRQISRVARERLGPQGRAISEAIDALDAAVAKTGKRLSVWTKGKKEVSDGVKKLRSVLNNQVKLLEKRYNELDGAIAAAQMRLNSLDNAGSPEALRAYNELVGQRVKLITELQEARTAEATADFLDSVIADLDETIGSMKDDINDPDFVYALARAELPAKIERRLVLAENSVEAPSVAEGVKWSPEDLQIDWFDDSPEMLDGLTRMDEITAKVDDLTASLQGADESTAAKINSEIEELNKESAQLRSDLSSMARPASVADMSRGMTAEDARRKVAEIEAEIADLESQFDEVFTDSSIEDARVERLKEAHADARRRRENVQRRSERAAVAYLRRSFEGELEESQRLLRDAATVFEAASASGDQARIADAEAALVAAYDEMLGKTEMLRYFSSKKGELTPAEREVYDALVSRTTRDNSVRGVVGPDEAEIRSKQALLRRWETIVNRRKGEHFDALSAAEKEIDAAINIEVRLRGKTAGVQAELDAAARELDRAKGLFLRAKAREAGIEDMPKPFLDQVEKQWQDVLAAQRARSRQPVGPPRPGRTTRADVDASIRERYGIAELTEDQQRRAYIEMQAKRRTREDAVAAGDRIVTAYERAVELEAQLQKATTKLDAQRAKVAELTEVPDSLLKQVRQGEARVAELTRDLEVARNTVSEVRSEDDLLNRIADSYDAYVASKADELRLQQQLDEALKAQAKTGRTFVDQAGDEWSFYGEAGQAKKRQIDGLKEVLRYYRKRARGADGWYRRRNFVEVEVEVPADLRPLSDIQQELDDIRRSVPMGAGGESVPKATYKGDVQAAIEQPDVSVDEFDSWSSGEILNGGYLVPKRVVVDPEQVAAANRVREINKELNDIASSLSKPRVSDTRRSQLETRRAALIAERDSTAVVARRMRQETVISREVIDAAPPEVREAYLDAVQEIYRVRDRQVAADAFRGSDVPAGQMEKAKRFLEPYIEELAAGRARFVDTERGRELVIRDAAGGNAESIPLTYDLEQAIDAVLDGFSVGVMRRDAQVASSSADVAVYGALAAEMGQRRRVVERANRLMDFMARYHAAVKAGAAPGPELANRVTEEIATRYEKKLLLEYQRMAGALGEIGVDLNDAAGVARTARKARRLAQNERQLQAARRARQREAAAALAAGDPELQAAAARLEELRVYLPYQKGKKKADAVRAEINQIEERLGLDLTSWDKKRPTSIDSLARERFDSELNWHIDRIDQYEADLADLDELINQLEKRPKSKSTVKPPMKSEKVKGVRNLERRAGESMEDFARRRLEFMRQEQLRSGNKETSDAWAFKAYQDFVSDRQLRRGSARLGELPADSDVAVLRALRYQMVEEKRQAIGELLQSVGMMTGNRIGGDIQNGGTAVGKFLRQIMGRDRELAAQLKAKGLKYDSLAGIRSLIDRLWEGRKPWADDFMQRQVLERFEQLGKTLEEVSQIRRGIGVKVGGEGDGLVRADWREALFELKLAPTEGKYGSLVDERRVYDDVLGRLKGDLRAKELERQQVLGQLEEARRTASRAPEIERQLDEVPTAAGAAAEKRQKLAAARSEIDDLELKQLEVIDMLEERYRTLASIDEVGAAEAERLDVLLEQQKLLRDGLVAAKKDMEARAARLAKSRETLKGLDPMGAKDFEKVSKQITGLLESGDIDKDLMPGLWLEQRWLDSLQEIATAEGLLGDAVDRVDNLITRLADGDNLVAPVYKAVFADVISQGLEVLGEGVLDEAARVAVSKELAGQLRNVEKAINSGDMFKVWSASLRYFKRWATARPGFFIRNTQSATFMNFADGVGLGDHMDAWRMWTGMAKGGRDYFSRLSPQEQLAFEIVWGTGTAGRYTAEEIGENMAKTLGGYLVDNPYLRFMGSAGAFSEGASRLAMAMNSVRRGDDLLEGIARITRIHFDYENLSKFDKAMKNIIPFWVFMSKNAPMQVQQMLMRPKAYIVYGRLVNSMDQSREGDILPQWITDRMGFKIDDTKMLNPDLGFTQLGEDVSMLANPLNGKILSSMAPMAKVPLELMANRDFYFGRDNSGMSTREKVVDAVADFNPQIRDFQRLFPGAANTIGIGEPRYEGREAQSWLSWFGVPLRQLTPESVEAEMRRRAYAN